MYKITATREFLAAHAIRLADGSIEPLHKHNWKLKVTVTADQLNSLGLVMDFHRLEAIMDSIITQVKDRSFNDLTFFKKEGIGPSAERIACWFGQEITKQLSGGVKLVSAEVEEEVGCFAVYEPDIIREEPNADHWSTHGGLI